jgi:hypothetical protein
VPTPSEIAVHSPSETAAPTPSETARATATPKRAIRRSHARAHAATEATATGFLSVESDPWGAVYVDGKRIADQTPAYRVVLQAGRHRVSVRNPERGHSPVRSVEVRAGENSVVGFEW